MTKEQLQELLESILKIFSDNEELLAIYEVKGEFDEVYPEVEGKEIIKLNDQMIQVQNKIRLLTQIILKITEEYNLKRIKRIELTIVNKKVKK